MISENLITCLKNAKHLTILTGAGNSAESIQIFKVVISTCLYSCLMDKKVTPKIITFIIFQLSLIKLLSCENHEIWQELE